MMARLCWQLIHALSPPRHGRGYRGPIRWLLRLAWAGVPVLPLRAVGADTGAPSGAAEAARIWSKDIWVEHLEKVWWGPYIDDDRDSIIVRKLDLEKQKGEIITQTLARQLTGDGQLDDNRLEDNEEAPLWYSHTITLRQFRNAIRLQGKLSEQRTAFDQGTLGRDLLKDWLARFLDTRIWTTVTTSFTSAIYGGSATSTATIQSGDYLTLAMLIQAKTLARKATPQIIPPKTQDGEYFVLGMSPDSAYDLQTRDPAYDEGHREAMERGATNPLFTGAEVVRQGVILRSCTRVPLATDWGAGANLNGSENTFFGLRTGILAIGRKPEMVIQVFDYENKTGYAIRMIAEIAKSTFNASDNAVIGVRTFRSNIS